MWTLQHVVKQIPQIEFFPLYHEEEYIILHCLESAY